MKLLTFDSQHLDVDWISFNIQGLTDPKTICSNLSKYFTPHVLMDDVPMAGIYVEPLAVQIHWHALTPQPKFAFAFGKIDPSPSSMENIKIINPNIADTHNPRLCHEPPRNSITNFNIFSFDPNCLIVSR